MRLFLIAAVCLAAGFGAGWGVFEEPRGPASAPLSQFTQPELERVMATIPRARDVQCREDHGPFYECTVYTAANAGWVYDVVVRPNGRCYDAKFADMDEEEELGWENTIQRDSDLPRTYTGW